MENRRWDPANMIEEFGVRLTFDAEKKGRKERMERSPGQANYLFLLLRLRSRAAAISLSFRSV